MVASARDSTGTTAAMAQIGAAIANYLNFYLAPDAAPKCAVTGVTREPGASAQDAVRSILQSSAS